MDSPKGRGGHRASDCEIQGPDVPPQLRAPGSVPRPLLNSPGLLLNAPGALQPLHHDTKTSIYRRFVVHVPFNFGDATRWVQLTLSSPAAAAMVATRGWCTWQMLLRGALQMYVMSGDGRPRPDLHAAQWQQGPELGGSYHRS